MQQLDLVEPTRLLDQENLGCAQLGGKLRKKAKMCSNHSSQQVLPNKCLPGRGPTQIPSLGHMSRKGMRRNVWNAVANCQTRKSSNYTQSPRFVWMITTSKNEELETVGELFKSLFTHCREVFLFGTHRQT